MAHLTLVGLSDDRTRLLLVNDDGDGFTLDVDTALRSAVRGEQPRPGHLETRMDSALRPRDIQARIRSGESAEAVAEAARSTVDKIMPYAAPVLAERAHVAERAQRSSIRRRASEGSGSLGGARTLQDAVAHQLRSHNVDPESVEWDAFRREDGKWTLRGLFESGPRCGVATFTFDMPGNYVTLDDDDARWLVGDARPAAPVAPDPVAEAPGLRRLSAVRSETSLGDDAIQLVTTPAQDTTPDFLRDFAADHDATQDFTGALGGVAGSAAEEGSEPATERTEQQPAAPAEPEPAAEEAPAEAPRKTSRKRGRASVPSWDEIMFGGGTGE
ncbi:septation protein SepH [Nocardioides daphniae]|nr:septation protein SepH [Nocardioides daphniae]GGD19476.1 DNA-binding protein [Nocardioides daphniae]